jgi:Ni2+-binding GTPase involved in maturation of urease and hydrogenase
MKIHLVTGFLGSGKTTAIHQACLASQKQGMKSAVIMNDQGSLLVDSLYFKMKGFPVLQVPNGCYCCNFLALNESLQTLVNTDQPELIFAEAVGSCTDIVATVMKPLQRSFPNAAITLSSFVDARLLLLIISGGSALFDETIRYIFIKQLEEAELIILNKTDLLSPEEKVTIVSYLQHHYPAKELIFQSIYAAEGNSRWLSRINSVELSEIPESLTIDYDTYAAGEARLAWLDKQLTIKTLGDDAEKIALILIQQIAGKIAAAGYLIGHLKFWLNDHLKISITAGGPLEIPDYATTVGESASLIINARVETTPDHLVRIIDSVIAELKSEFNCTIEEGFSEAFQPGYPTPTHRIID